MAIRQIEPEDRPVSLIEAVRESVDTAGMVERLSQEGYEGIKMTMGPGY